MSASVKKFLKAAQDIKDQAHHRKDDAKPPVSHDEGNWLMSYADMMTLLCGFFILLFSMAKMDEPAYEKVKESVAKQFGGEYKPPSKELGKFVTQIIQEAGIEAQTTVKMEGTGVTVAFQSTLFFDTMSAEVRPEGREAMEKLIVALGARQKSENKQFQLIVEGHTDSRPILGGSFASNWELSGSRAARVVRYFIEKGFDPAHLTAIGYGETRPQVPSRLPNGTYDESALSKNRRVVLRILEPGADTIPMAGTPGAPSAAPATAAVNAPAARSPAAESSTH
jgi:chemotaxis protein MotB